jgi:hypothetical protein
MSTRVGTLHAPRAVGSILVAAILASFVILMVAISLDRDQGRQGETTFVGRHTFNTPSELNAQIGAARPKTVAGGTLANTPTELSGWIRHKFASDTPGTNTPTELTGGFIMVNGHERTVPLS